MKLKPAPGRAVRDPESYELLPEEGRNVPDNQFWRRRLRDGDVVKVEAEAPAPQARPAEREAEAWPEAVAETPAPEAPRTQSEGV